MRDNDAAYIMPVGGNTSVHNGNYVQQVQPRYANSVNEWFSERQAGRRILLVEDDASLAALAAEVLIAHGYTVVTVESGEGALALLRTVTPDLVVLDLELTGVLTGLDVLQALRSYATIPVLFTTSATTEVRKYTRQTGESRETLDSLPKPYTMPVLLKRVQRMLTIASHEF
jgi:DNA-binding response OmpR family regulator